MTTKKATVIAITTHETHSHYVIILTFSSLEDLDANINDINGKA